MHETGCSGLVHWDDPEGWDGEEGGKGGSGWGTQVQSWLIHVNVWQTPLQYCKVISLQLDKLIKKKKKVLLGQPWDNPPSSALVSRGPTFSIHGCSPLIFPE